VSCSTNATRSAGGSVSSTTSSASPTESASTTSDSGPSTAATLAIASSGSSGSSRLDLRERSMSRHTRATMVVNHPSRLATPSAPAADACIQPSCTASSASLSEPSIR
jgi:hypothetical protein